MSLISAHAQLQEHKDTTKRVPRSRYTLFLHGEINLQVELRRQDKLCVLLIPRVQALQREIACRRASGRSKQGKRAAKPSWGLL